MRFAIGDSLFQYHGIERLEKAYRKISRAFKNSKKHVFAHIQGRGAAGAGVCRHNTCRAFRVSELFQRPHKAQARESDKRSEFFRFGAAFGAHIYILGNIRQFYGDKRGFQKPEFHEPHDRQRDFGNIFGRADTSLDIRRNPESLLVHVCPAQGAMQIRHQILTFPAK